MGRPRNLKARQRILETALELFHARGFQGVSMDDVAAEAGLRKSNLFHYYPTKEELGRAVIEQACGSSRDRIARQLTDGDPIKAVTGVFKEYAAELKAEDCAKGCFIGNLAQELNARNERLRAKVSEHLRHWTQELSTYLERHRAAGYFRKGFDARQSADALVALLEGAILLSKATRRPQALRHAGTMAERYLRGERA